MEEQGWLARLVHLLHSDDNDTQFRLLQMTRKAYSEGNERIRTTTPPLITAGLKLARRFKAREHYDDNWSSQSSSLFKFLHSAVSTLYTRVNGAGAAELSLRLFCACGQTADAAGFEEVAYEFFAQAFTVYEEAVSDSKAQFQAVCVIASALHRTRNFGKENYDTLITKCAQHASKLLRKPDQCRAVYLASHLWWATPLVGSSEGDDSDVSHPWLECEHDLTCASSTVTESVCSSVSNEHFALRMLVWRLPRRLNYLLRFWIDTCITLIKRMSRYVARP
jgi:vacuolar protein sorting-associated protein 35